MGHLLFLKREKSSNHYNKLLKISVKGYYLIAMPEIYHST